MSKIYTKKEILEAFEQQREPRIFGLGKIKRYLDTKDFTMTKMGIKKRLDRSGVKKINGWYRMTTKEINHIFHV